MTVQEMNNRESQSSSGFLSFITEKLRNQMLLAFMLSSLLPLLIFGFLTYNRVSNSFRSNSFQALDAVRVNKASQIEYYFDRAAEETKTFALSPLMVDVMQDFTAGVEAAEFEFSDLVTDVDAHRNELAEFYEAEFPLTFESASGELLGQISLEALILQHQYILVANEVLAGGETHGDTTSAEIIVHSDGDEHDAEDHELRAHQTGEFFLSDGSSSTYDKAHIAYHNYFIEALHGLGFNDMKLVSLDGDIIYTHLKSFDFMTSLADGPYADTNLGRAYRSALAADSAEFTTIVDFEPYQPSLDEPASFIAAPIFDGATKIGVLILELPLNAIADITNEHEGLGESGETYLIGTDNLWRNDSRFLDQLDTDSTILNPDFVVDTVAVQSAQNGQLGTQIIDDYRGVPVLSSWQPLVIQEGDESGRESVIWSLMAEMDEAEVQGATNSLAVVGLALIGLISMLLVGFAVMFSRFLTRQIDLVVNVFDAVQDGNLDERVDVISDDEVGQLAFGLNGLLDQLQGTLSETQSERDELQTSIAKLLDEVSDVAEGDLTIEADVSSESTGAIADSINYMLEQLREVILRVKDTTLEVSSSATQIQTTAEHLAQGSEQQAAQIIETSTAIDEMSVSIQKVSENTQLSSQVGIQARDSAQKGTKAVEDTIEGMIRIRQNVSETSKRIKSLGETSQEIGEIVDLIRNITNRTAILALNASIQAARAGEAGRSFVVVAEEIERLSERSGEATRQIADLVKAIQSETGLAVNSMEATTNEVVIGSKLANEAGIALLEIDQVSDRLAELTQSTAQAAQQQATSSEAIAHSMNDIAGVTQETASGTKQASQSILSLAELADELRQSVSEFKLDDQDREAETEGGPNERTYVSGVNALTSLN